MKKVIALLFVVLITLISCAKEDDTTSIDSPAADAVVVSNNKKGTGTSSRDLLSDVKFKSMVIELVYVKGFEPSATAINTFVSFIEARTFKPGGITVLKREIASSGKTTFTNEEITAIEDANRTKYNTVDQIAVWALFVDGDSASNEGNSVVLGTAYRNTSFVIYENTIKKISDNSFSSNRSLLEATVIEHEFSHILGLTNLGAPLQSNHEDTDHAKHCNVANCLMYYLAETQGGIGNMISGGSVPTLDAQCLADLKANGGR